MNSIYLLSLSVWIGGIVFFSFIAAPSLFGVLPPEYAGKAVGAIFPKYFPLGTISGMVAFVCLTFSAAKTGNWPLIKMLIVLMMLTCNIYNGLVSHPRARALKEEMQTETGKTDIAHLKTEFDRAHRASVANNILVLLLGAILIYLTAKGLIL